VATAGSNSALTLRGRGRILQTGNVKSVEVPCIVEGVLVRFSSMRTSGMEVFFRPPVVEMEQSCRCRIVASSS